MLILILISTLVIGVLVCAYPNDLPFERRNYMQVSNLQYGRAPIDSQSQQHLSRSSSYSGS